MLPDRYFLIMKGRDEARAIHAIPNPKQTSTLRFMKRSDTYAQKINTHESTCSKRHDGSQLAELCVMGDFDGKCGKYRKRRQDAGDVLNYGGQSGNTDQ